MTAPALIEHEYHAHGAAADLFACRAPEVLIEGPAGTGKTRAVLELINYLCEEYPGIRVLICRQTRASLTESVLVTWEDKVLWTGHPALSGSEASRQNRHSYVFPNASVVVAGSLETPERLFSTEWDVVYVAEATEISEDAWEKFGRAMRSHQMPWQMRIADCNPVHPGHWLNIRASTPKMVRLKSRHADNPSCTSEYLTVLSNLSGHRRARLYEGRWVAGEGSVYQEFSEDRHVITPFAIPQQWPHYLGLDPGYDHPCAILWFSVAPNGCLYVVDELYRGGLSVQQHARDIHARNAGRTIIRYYADPQHAFSSTAQSPKSIASQFKDFGLSFVPWPRTKSKEESMVEAVRKRLIEDKLKVFATCQKTIQEFQSWSYKRTASGEMPPGEDKFEDANNHAMDVVKGVVASNPKHKGAGVTIE